MGKFRSTATTLIGISDEDGPVWFQGTAAERLLLVENPNLNKKVEGTRINS
ncbi:hypothetical protein LINPERPRIM_LOCUS6477 [Linum perenne]